MDETWLDRDKVAANITGVNARELTYDPGSGLYYRGEEPFTGVTLTWWPGRLLGGVSHFRNGLAHGVAVGWYRNGKVRAYNDMQDGVCHGWHMEWAADGTLKIKEYCVDGQPQRGKR